MNTTIQLTIRAKDNHGHEYAVCLGPNRYGNDPVLFITNTPGHWALDESLRRYAEDEIAIDFGQGWYCINFQDVLREACAVADGGSAS